MNELAFLSGWIVSAIFALWFICHFIAADPLPGIERRRVFRYVHREDRDAYVRIMRRTMAVKMRDLGRQMTIFSRTIRKTVTPALQRFVDVLGSIRKPPEADR